MGGANCIIRGSVPRVKMVPGGRSKRRKVVVEEEEEEEE